jgi:hypothetical protein
MKQSVVKRSDGQYEVTLVMSEAEFSRIAETFPAEDTDDKGGERKLKFPSLPKPKWPDLKCATLLASPLGVQAIAAVKAAKAAGLIKDKQQCFGVAGDVAALTGIIGDSTLAGLIAGEMTKCACKVVF